MGFLVGDFAITARTQPSSTFDVVIVGGGPSGSTASTLLKKYNTSLRILVIEKEVFPRDHIGESQLPSISAILDEMGVWDKIEAADFPIKIGASYTWGRDKDQWDFSFFPVESWRDEPRPAKFEGQRRFTAFQVDRAIYDDILLNHAREVGVEVRQPVAVTEINTSGDRIESLTLSNGEVVSGRYYIDASGNVGLLRRALNINVDITQELKNIAIWDYWQNTEWAERIGVGGTRVQVRSLPYGWIWFIPLSPTRTSIGLIVNADYYKKLGKAPEDLYLESLAMQPEIHRLTTNATREGKFTATKDWSQLADRVVGDNWFLVGESAGFADPILAAGLSLAHASARDAAYTILELDRGRHDSAWLRRRFDDRNRTNIRQHIRFAQYWYSANGCFTELQEHCTRIAKEAGINLNPQKAWAWLAQGGFISEALDLPTFGSFDVASAKQVINRFAPSGAKPVGYLASGYNVFKLNLRGATKTGIGHLENGEIKKVECYLRGESVLPIVGLYGEVFDVLQQSSDAKEIIAHFRNRVIAGGGNPDVDNAAVFRYIQALEVLIDQYWVSRESNSKKPAMRIDADDSRYLRTREETLKVLEEQGAESTIQFN